MNRQPPQKVNPPLPNTQQYIVQPPLPNQQQFQQFQQQPPLPNQQQSQSFQFMGQPPLPNQSQQQINKQPQQPPSNENNNQNQNKSVQPPKPDELIQNEIESKPVEKRLSAYKQQQLEKSRQKFAPKNLKAENEIERLLTEQFQNPYDILYLVYDSTEDDIKKAYRNFSIILHPDKCKDERARDAFTIVERAHQILSNLDKRKVYLRIMKEAEEKTEYEREKENKRRSKLGLSLLPEDTFESDYRANVTEMFKIIEEKKIYMAKLEGSKKAAKLEELENKRMLDQYKTYTEEEWETTRDQRIDNWRNFSKKSRVLGTKKSDRHLRPPETKQEQRPNSAPKLDFIESINQSLEEYKKKWK